LQDSISDTREYQTGGVKEIEHEYKAVLNTSVPSVEYITIQSTGGMTFRKAFYNSADFLTKILEVDGSGSDIDADKLDGQHGSHYLPAGTYTAADILSKILTVDGNGSGLDADKLDGQHGSHYLPAGTYTAADILSKILTVDGNGSGLDADFFSGLKPGDFGRVVSGVTDLNAITEKYAFFYSDIDPANCPNNFSYAQGIQFCYDNNSNFKQQLVITYGLCYYRSQSSGIWGDWCLLIHGGLPNVNLDGFTKLGLNSPAIKYKKLTGTTPSSSYQVTDIAHGLTQSKILSCAVIVDNTYLPNTEIGSEYSVYVMSSNIRIALKDAGLITSKGIKVLLVYEE
jgi:hypothetical protein